MTNQQVVDFIRAELAEKTPLDEICEMLMDNCLAPDSEVGGLGCDNMSVIIVGILNGKTLDEWYDWIASRVASEKKTDALGNTIEPDGVVEKVPMNEEDEEDLEDEDLADENTLKPEPKLNTVGETETL